MRLPQELDGITIIRDAGQLYVVAQTWPGLDGRWRFRADDAPGAAIKLAVRIARRRRHPMAALMTQQWFWQPGEWRRVRLVFSCFVHAVDCAIDPSPRRHPMQLRAVHCPLGGELMRFARSEPLTSEHTERRSRGIDRELAETAADRATRANQRAELAADRAFLAAERAELAAERILQRECQTSTP